MAAHILIETLNQTKNSAVLNLSEISRRSGTTPTITRRVLTEFNGPDDIAAPLEQFDRFKLARESARLGMISEAARALTWQEFEAFTEDCLIASGFQTRKGLIIRDTTRNWQIDIDARKGSMILAIDCKHWKSPNFSSRFKKSAEHQRLAVAALLGQMKKNQASAKSTAWALPVIVTLFDPRVRTLNRVVLVSVGQLSDFLQYVTPYEPDLPFMKVSNIVESPIS